MSRRVSRPAAALLALIITLAAPSAFAAQRGRGFEPRFGTQIVKFLKSLSKKFFIGSQEDIDVPSPPKP